MYVFWRSVCRIQAWWRGTWARWGVKIGKPFGIVGSGGGRGIRGGKVRTPVSAPSTNAPFARSVQGSDITATPRPEELISGASAAAGGDDLTKMMFQLVLQQQQLGQMWSQQQQLMQQQNPLSLGQEQQQLVPATSPSRAMVKNASKESDSSSIAQLREELDRSRQLMEERVSSLQAERDREVKELLQFKEMASAHLRAQNLTIKRLSHGRGVGGGRAETTSSAARAMMDRVRPLGPKGKQVMK